ncbi:MAG: hypothetical protein FWC51_02560 [Proteobacteria bacterium]|nr:hypothetical protein [Pseudomonadota bacterium]
MLLRKEIFNSSSPPAASTDWDGRDAKNLAYINRALASGKIDDDTADRLRVLYADGMGRFRELFYVLGKFLGAPKTPIFQYDRAAGHIVDSPVKISDITPAHAYLVHHRFDADPMRNQFFNFDSTHNVWLSVSSIVTVIIGAQKRIERSIEKITDEKYADFTDRVVDATRRVLTARANAAAANAVADKIKKRFSEKFITNAAEEVLAIIGRGHEKIAVELIRELDKIERPVDRLKDVYRIKLLFDMVPQARAFMDGITATVPEKVIGMRDNFFDTKNSRNYRDAKLVLNIGTGDSVIPMEIICQVRTFFDFEKQSHNIYEDLRTKKSNAQVKITKLHEEGIKQYDQIVCTCVGELLYRVGWNILYTHDRSVGEGLFDGFPRFSLKHYPPEIVENIIGKLRSNVQNEVFKIENSPRELSKAEEMHIFEYMTRFILAAAMPCSDWKDTGAGTPTKLFNFVMSETARYCKSD